MDKLEKFLKKLSKKRQQKIFLLLFLLGKREIENLDIKKLKNSKYYRLRSGKLRVIFYYKDGIFILVDIAFRDENTYKNNKRY